MKRQNVIILHGWNLSGGRFSGLVDELRQKGCQVFAPDLPGFGNEPPPKQPWHISDYATFLNTYIKQKHIEKPLLIGHSFGGRVALQFTYMYPKVPKKLVLTGTPGYSPVLQKKINLFFILAKIGGVIFMVPGINLLSDIARKVLYRMAGAREFYRAEGSMRQTFKNVVSDDLVPAMRSISIPCFLVWGEQDNIVPVMIAQKMRDTIASSSLVVIPQASHAVPYRQPNQFVSTIWKFLQS